jgi:hypothetical protein
VDVVSEEDCTDMKTDEVYRLSVLSVKTEYEVSIVMKCFCGAYFCVCVCFVTCSLLDSFTCVNKTSLVYTC